MREKVEVDKVLAAIIGNALKAITDEMSLSMEKTTRSPILCEAKDFVTGLYDAEGRMLEQTAMPISEIALACGFSSPAYFSLQYRIAHGASPSQVRRQVHETVLMSSVL